jgi:hypothetical protein
LRQRRLKEVFDFLRHNECGHCANMLTMRRRMGNEVKPKSSKGGVETQERIRCISGILHLGHKIRVR